MENKLTNYIALTLAMILLSNIMCCIGILIFQTPQQDDLLLNTITKKKQYAKNY